MTDPVPAADTPHPALTAYLAAREAWAKSLTAENGMVGYRRLKLPTKADAEVSKLNRAAQIAYRAWVRAGSPLYVIEKKEPTK